MVVERGLGVRIERKAPTKLYPFTRFFKGFEEHPAGPRPFGRHTPRVLAGIKVEFFSARFGYMGTSDVDGHLIISTHHLRDSDFRTVYLDLVHELCHVRQFRKGRPLFYPKLSYVDAPSEIEAYRFTVKEGRRIGMNDRETPRVPEGGVDQPVRAPPTRTALPRHDRTHPGSGPSQATAALAWSRLRRERLSLTGFEGG